MMRSRWVTVWLCFLATAVAYIDRANLAVGAPFIKTDLHINDATMGVVLGSFYWSYAALQVPCGWMVDRVRLRIGVAAAIAVWSLATIGTAWSRGTASLLAFRLLLGAGEGPIYPASAKIVGMRFLPKERGRASGTVVCGNKAGTFIALPMVSAIIAGAGWRASFVATGLIGLLLAAAWVWLYRDAPAPPRPVAAPPAMDGAAMLAVLRHRCFLGVAGGAFCMLFAAYFYSTWYPTYLVRARGFTLAELGTLGALPVLAALPAPYLGGLLSDHLINRGWSVSQARKVCLTAGALMGSSVALVPLIHNDAAMIAAFCISDAGLGMTGGLLWSLPAEIAPGERLVGTVGSMMNCIGNIAGFASPAFVGALLTVTGGSFDAPLWAMGAVCVLCAASFKLLAGEFIRIPLRAVTVEPAGLRA